MPTKRILTPTAGTTAAEWVPLDGVGRTWPIHLGAALWIGIMLALAQLAPLQYNAFVQEDRFVEWWTVLLFGAAALVRARAAWPRRRVFDLGVAAFCIFVAGEEFSWGQRLLGFTPPAPFLEHNTQQELTLHNFADVFGRPKFTLIAVLFGYAVLLPLATRSRSLKPWLDRIGAGAPAGSTVVWFAVAILLLLVYPVEFTGEWVEALAGGLFLLAARPAPPTIRLTGVLSVGLALGLSALSARGVVADAAASDCARLEASALLRDIRSGAATDQLLEHGGSVHKRVYSALQDGYLDASAFREFRRVHCGKSQLYALDPWGLAYWVRVSRARDDDVRTITVYSMGANRRRDHSPGGPVGDDVIAETSARLEPAHR